MAAASEQTRIRSLEGLSTVIIETLKSLSTEQKPLSVSFLSQALGKRDEVQKMLAEAYPGDRQNGAAQAVNGKNGRSGADSPVKFADHDTLLKAAVEEQEEILRMRDFLRRSTTTLVSLVNRSGTGKTLSKNLTAFRNAVQDGGHIDGLEKSLDQLKNSIKVIGEDEEFQDTAPPPRENVGVLDREQPRRTGEVGALQLPRLKSIFLNIIAEFDHDLGEDYAKKIARFRKGIQSGAGPDDLAAMEDELISLIQAYNRTMNEERNQITDFISEIGNSLIEIEQQFLHSMTQSEHSHTANSSFNHLIESHMDEMKKSAQLSTTLAEFKSLVISRLATIREALAQKRKAEELREETMHGEVEDLQQSLKRMKKEIDQVHEKRKALEKEILIDQLTGIANRRAAKRRLKEEIQRYQRYRQFFSVLLFDIDHFKSVNDRFGHWAGDKCLKELIKRIKPMLRETDFLARWGGEEFVILFPGTEVESASGVAERLRKAIENTRFLYNRQEIAVTVSIGVTEVKSGDMTLEAIFNRTDKAMYDAKRKGRNLVVTG
ncbi:MAG: diguanylate cyclase [Syntrophobacteraceae bacterium]